MLHFVFEAAVLEELESAIKQYTGREIIRTTYEKQEEAKVLAKKYGAFLFDNKTKKLQDFNVVS